MVRPGQTRVIGKWSDGTFKAAEGVSSSYAQRVSSGGGSGSTKTAWVSGGGGGGSKTATTTSTNVQYTTIGGVRYAIIPGEGMKALPAGFQYLPEHMSQSELEAASTYLGRTITKSATFGDIQPKTAPAELIRQMRLDIASADLPGTKARKQAMWKDKLASMGYSDTVDVTETVPAFAGGLRPVVDTGEAKFKYDAQGRIIGVAQTPLLSEAERARLSEQARTGVFKNEKDFYNYIAYKLAHPFFDPDVDMNTLQYEVTQVQETRPELVVAESPAYQVKEFVISEPAGTLDSGLFGGGYEKGGIAEGGSLFGDSSKAGVYALGLTAEGVYQLGKGVYDVGRDVLSSLSLEPAKKYLPYAVEAITMIPGEYTKRAEAFLTTLSPSTIQKVVGESQVGSFSDILSLSARQSLESGYRLADLMYGAPLMVAKDVLTVPGTVGYALGKTAEEAGTRIAKTPIGETLTEKISHPVFDYAALELAKHPAAMTAISAGASATEEVSHLLGVPREFTTKIPYYENNVYVGDLTAQERLVRQKTNLDASTAYLKDLEGKMASGKVYVDENNKPVDLGKMVAEARKNVEYEQGLVSQTTEEVKNIPQAEKEFTREQLAGYGMGSLFIALPTVFGTESLLSSTYKMTRGMLASVGGQYIARPITRGVTVGDYKTPSLSDIPLVGGGLATLGELTAGFAGFTAGYYGTDLPKVLRGDTAYKLAQKESKYKTEVLSKPETSEIPMKDIETVRQQQIEGSELLRQKKYVAAKTPEGLNVQVEVGISELLGEKVTSVKPSLWQRIKGRLFPEEPYTSVSGEFQGSEVWDLNAPIEIKMTKPSGVEGATQPVSGTPSGLIDVSVSPPKLPRGSGVSGTPTFEQVKSSGGQINLETLPTYVEYGWEGLTPPIEEVSGFKAIARAMTPDKPFITKEMLGRFGFVYTQEPGETTVKLKGSSYVKLGETEVFSKKTGELTQPNILTRLTAEESGLINKETPKGMEQPFTDLYNTNIISEDTITSGGKTILKTETVKGTTAVQTEAWGTRAIGVDIGKTKIKWITPTGKEEVLELTDIKPSVGVGIVEEQAKIIAEELTLPKTLKAFWAVAEGEKAQVKIPTEIQYSGPQNIWWDRELRSVGQFFKEPISQTRLSSRISLIQQVMPAEKGGIPLGGVGGGVELPPSTFEESIIGDLADYRNVLTAEAEQAVQSFKITKGVSAKIIKGGSTTTGGGVGVSSSGGVVLENILRTEPVQVVKQMPDTGLFQSSIMSEQVRMAASQMKLSQVQPLRFSFPLLQEVRTGTPQSVVVVEKPSPLPRQILREGQESILGNEVGNILRQNAGTAEQTILRSEPINILRSGTANIFRQEIVRTNKEDILRIGEEVTRTVNIFRTPTTPVNLYRMGGGETGTPFYPLMFPSAPDMGGRGGGMEGGLLWGRKTVRNPIPTVSELIGGRPLLAAKKKKKKKKSDFERLAGL